jgi:hypothetical protein
VPVEKSRQIHCSVRIIRCSSQNVNFSNHFQTRFRNVPQNTI